MKRLAINPAGLSRCCVAWVLGYMAKALEMPEGTMLQCPVCSRRLIVQEGAWRAHPAGVTS